MKDLPQPARIYISIIFGLGFTIAFLCVPALVVDRSLVLPTFVLALIIGILDIFSIPLIRSQRNNNIEIILSAAVKMAAIFIFPQPVVILATFGGTFFSELACRHKWYKTIFNVGAMTVDIAVISTIYLLIYQPDVPLLGSPRNLVALASLVLGDVVLNAFMVSMVIALATKSRLWYVWQQNHKPLLLNDLTMLPLAVFIYILWQYTPWSVILAALPLWVMRHSYQLVAQLGRQTREALQALARVLDERDEHTSQHSELVAEHAGGIARALGLSAEEVDIIMRAAALHDIGKVGMRNDVLFKSGPLTLEERDHAQRHAVIGGDLLEKFPMFEKGAAYVRHHHERWDGTGYPDRLAGELIPLGARILAIADAYQAMVEERPYRKPLPPDEVIRQLREGAGRQFDPKLVQVFLEIKGLTPLPVETIPLNRAEQITAV